MPAILKVNWLEFFYKITLSEIEFKDDLSILFREQLRSKVNLDSQILNSHVSLYVESHILYVPY